MRSKLISVCLLLVCFVWLAVLSGALPIRTEAPAVQAAALMDEPAPPTGTPPSPSPEVTAEPSPSAPPSPTATAQLTPSPTPEPSPSISPAPTAEPDPTPIPPTASPTATEGPTVIRTTITGSSILDNDTRYAVDPTSALPREFPLSLSGSGAQILIIHSHTTEAYLPDPDDPYEQSAEFRTTDTEHSVIRVGEALAETLRAYGLRVIHDTTLYDYPVYDGAYARSGEAISSHLEEEPTIGLILDIHRDAIGDEEVIYRTVTEADGADAAQLMLVVGTDINLEHPNWRENLALALSLQTAVAQRWERLMRPVTLCDARYNQQLSPGCLLLEIGTTGNTLDEAIRAVELFGNAVGPLLAAAVGE